jgi:hypothetical protein
MMPTERRQKCLAKKGNQNAASLPIYCDKNRRMVVTSARPNQKMKNRKCVEKI